MQIVETALPGVLILEPCTFGDERGFFLESWNRDTFRNLGLDLDFVQDNHSRSAKGVLRGQHYQLKNPQGKLVSVVAGAVFDVAVDIRRSSPSFGKWIGVELTAANRRLLWIPPGFAHGFVTLLDGTDFLYKCTEFYDPSEEHSLLWNDSEIGITWPLDGLNVQLSNKDKIGKPLADAPLFV